MTPSPALIAYLSELPGRCPACGFAVAEQGHRATCPQRSEWSTFVAALKKAVRDDGTVRQGDVRPLIQAIPHKHRGQQYAKAIREGLLREVRRERSTDVAGRNTNKLEPVYVLRSAA